MHRDHEDYKPWRCHICYERTAFVKTLYRHLKKEHGMSGAPCPVCGKMFSRAQSMLHHVNKVRRELQVVNDISTNLYYLMFVAYKLSARFSLDLLPVFKLLAGKFVLYGTNATAGTVSDWSQCHVRTWGGIKY